MLAHILLSFCFFAIIFCAPVDKKILPKKIKPVSSVILPNIDLPDSAVNKYKYELLGGGHEGDMIFPVGFNLSSLSDKKGVAIFGSHRWPNNIIPYDISAINSTQNRNLILQSMNTLMYAVGTPISGQTSRKSCVYFRPKRKNDKKFFKITYGAGCSAPVGYWINMPLIMTLNDPGCFYMGTIQHELMHILGFYHEQSRPDRDTYISINYANIQHGQEYNFDKFEWGQSVVDQKTPYDLQSIMHYAANAFSVNGKPTIIPKRSNVVLGQREQLSAIDITEIRAFYGC